MKLVGYLLLASLYTSNSLAQGAWNIEYLHVDSINNTWLGKDIRIDFKGSDTDTAYGNGQLIYIRTLLATSDTVIIHLNDKPVQFIEQWRIYPDHGVVNEQSLLNKNKRAIIEIKEMTLQAINDSSFNLEVMVYDAQKQSKKEHIIIPRRIVKGILYRKVN